MLRKAGKRRGKAGKGSDVLIEATFQQLKRSKEGMQKIIELVLLMKLDLSSADSRKQLYFMDKWNKGIDKRVIAYLDFCLAGHLGQLPEGKPGKGTKGKQSKIGLYTV